ncbi:hypothetical protein J2744_000606 [Halorubrum trapanicum]|uniref:Uncharacterized protein n=1 Tax=Halorubrum trapanicum TaxID=29284 RepID=A0A8J7R7D0_9EURY|nr:hypothetical protein [Halorubrum trapanicum]MBP1900948.1 hypothetical protein [Halorubrum trapanicum]
MTTNATRRPRDRSTRPNGEGSFRRAVPMAGTGDGPRPDATAFTSATRTAGGHNAEGRSADGRRTTTNRTADDATTQ